MSELDPYSCYPKPTPTLLEIPARIFLISEAKLHAKQKVETQRHVLKVIKKVDIIDF